MKVEREEILSVLEVLAQSFVSDMLEIPLHFIEAHRLILHEAVEDDGLVFAGNQRESVAVTGSAEIRVLNAFCVHSFPPG